MSIFVVVDLLRSIGSTVHYLDWSHKGTPLSDFGFGFARSIVTRRGKKYVQIHFLPLSPLALKERRISSPLLSPRKPFNPPNHLRCPCRAPPDQTSYSSAVVSPTKSGIDRIWSGGVRAVGVRASALKRLTLIRNHHVSFALWVFGRHSVCLSFSERLNRRTIL